MATKPTALPVWGTATGSNVVTGLDVDTITFQGQDATGQYFTRYEFNSSPDLSSALIGHFLVASSATNTENSGTFKIKEVNNTDKYIDVFNGVRQDSTKDEATDSPATAIITDNGSVKTQPSTAKQEQGWLSPEKPADGHFNWYMNLVYLWIKWVNDGGAADLQHYDSIADLKAADTSSLVNKSNHFVKGFYIYQYDVDSTASVDNEYILLPDSGTGRYLAIIPDINSAMAITDTKISNLQTQIEELQIRIKDLEGV